MHDNQIIKAFARFLSLKTVITLVIVLTFCIRTLQGVEMPDAFVMIATAVITYYFCRDSGVEERMREHEKKYHETNTHEARHEASQD